MRRYLSLFLALACICCMDASAQAIDAWTGTWAAAAEYTGQNDMPQTTSLANTALRQVVRVSIGGKSLRLQLSNENSAEAVEIKAVYIAEAKDSCDIDRKTVAYLEFSGKRQVTIEPGKAAWSDALRYDLQPLQRLSVTICYGEQVPTNATSHRGSRTTSFISKGEANPKKAFLSIERLDHWYNISKIEEDSRNLPCSASTATSWGRVAWRP